MIVEPPYDVDWQIFPRLDVADQWIFDKLELSTRLGHSCGPENVIPPAGDYCVRPQQNLFGMGKGGFFKVNTSNWMQETDYFWCEWFDGPHHWVQYINDVAKSYCTGILNGDMLECEQAPAPQAPPLPAVLQNFSRYMLTELIGDKIIEATPRFMPECAQQRFVADYKSIDPQYNPNVNFGITDMKREPVTLSGHAGHTWGEHAEYRRRPYT